MFAVVVLGVMPCDAAKPVSTAGRVLKEADLDAVGLKNNTMIRIKMRDYQKGRYLGVVNGTARWRVLNRKFSRGVPNYSYQEWDDAAVVVPDLCGAPAGDIEKIDPNVPTYQLILHRVGGDVIFLRALTTAQNLLVRGFNVGVQTMVPAGSATMSWCELEGKLSSCVGFATFSTPGFGDQYGRFNLYGGNAEATDLRTMALFNVGLKSFFDLYCCDGIWKFSTHAFNVSGWPAYDPFKPEFSSVGALSRISVEIVNKGPEKDELAARGSVLKYNTPYEIVPAFNTNRRAWVHPWMRPGGVPLSREILFGVGDPASDRRDRGTDAVFMLKVRGKPDDEEQRVVMYGDEVEIWTEKDALVSINKAGSIYGAEHAELVVSADNTAKTIPRNDSTFFTIQSPFYGWTKDKVCRNDVISLFNPNVGNVWVYPGHLQWGTGFWMPLLKESNWGRGTGWDRSISNCGLYIRPMGGTPVKNAALG